MFHIGIICLPDGDSGPLFVLGGTSGAGCFRQECLGLAAVFKFKLSGGTGFDSVLGCFTGDFGSFATGGSTERVGIGLGRTGVTGLLTDLAGTSTDCIFGARRGLGDLEVFLLLAANNRFVAGKFINSYQYCFFIDD